jgi:ribosomal protein S18 acetylase RimI-like enzyme
MLKIRAFRKGDEEVYVKVHNEGYSSEEWFGTLEKALTVEDFSKLNYDATFFAEVNEKVIGLLDIKIRNQLVDIENIVVLPEYRRRGIGKALLEKAIEFSRHRKLKKVRCEVPTHNERAIKFYVKNGFQHLTNAYLIRVQDKLSLEQYLGVGIYIVEDNKYWVINERQMKLIKNLRVPFFIIGEFDVMVKNI